MDVVVGVRVVDPKVVVVETGAIVEFEEREDPMIVVVGVKKFSSPFSSGFEHPETKRKKSPIRKNFFTIRIYSMVYA